MKKQEIKDRISPKTTPKGWAKIRNIALIVSGVGGIIISPVCPFTLGVTALLWTQFIVTVSGTIAGTAHLTKK